LDKNVKFYGYFTFTTKIIEGSDLDNLLSLNELIKLKDSINPKIPSSFSPLCIPAEGAYIYICMGVKIEVTQLGCLAHSFFILFCLACFSNFYFHIYIYIFEKGSKKKTKKK
jgi:hypothetical protein